MGSRGRTTDRTSKRTFGICTPGSIVELPGEAVTKGVHTEGERAARPLGIASLEDKILQRATVEV